MKQQLSTKNLRRLVGSLNNDRKIQAKKIDILCNDLISAHRSFIKGLRSLSFAADFYESIIGIRRLDELLYTTAMLIKNEVPDTDLVFFLRKEKGVEKFEYHSNPKDENNCRLERYFNGELIDNIFKSNKIISLEQMLEIGLQLSPAMLNQLSAFVIPLVRSQTPVGFILLYRITDPKLSISQLRDVASITTGLSGAIEYSSAGQMQIGGR